MPAKPSNKSQNRAKSTPDTGSKPWLKGRAVKAKPEKRTVPVASGSRQEEVKVYGENACLELYKNRAESIIRLYVNAQMAPRFASLMKYLAEHKKAYHLVEDAELEKVAASQHHGGIVLLVKRKPIASLASYLAKKSLNRDCLLALDGVGNPHNLGAIVRTCAHFGVTGIIMRDPQLLYSGAALRTAEGGGEYIAGLGCDDMPLALRLCKEAGYQLITTSSHKGQSLYHSDLPAKAVIVFGEEMFGVSTAVAQTADVSLQIPGTGKVESLNVSVAASLILGEWYRQHSAQ
ncbi:tRNA/rRNA methyltransferase [Arsukibacterium sp.]|uniref:tRNA/rRNA methyltransferase n=1 Tax=Arsukibacterium sp. TaxID=1977258 RepID=UPI002FD9113D